MSCSQHSEAAAERLDEEVEACLVANNNVSLLQMLRSALPSEDSSNDLQPGEMELLSRLDAESLPARRRSAPEPVVSRDFLFFQAIQKARDALARELANPDRKSLRATYRHHLWGGHRAEAWALAEEFTRRGIPPSFRVSPIVDGEPRIPKQDILLHDLQWFVTRYPDHQVLMRRYSRLFEPEKFEATTKFLLWKGLHGPAFYIRALALTDDQQTECIYLRGAPVRERMDLIKRLDGEVFERINRAHMANPRARGQGQPERTVRRRHDIWLCGSMAGWQPKRTAELYKALTGEEMTRSLAGKLIEEVHGAYPESKPPQKRRRRTKAAKPKVITGRRGNRKRNKGTSGAAKGVTDRNG